MMNEQTYKQLMEMRLFALANSFKEFIEKPAGTDALTFEERLGIMVDIEWSMRQDRQLKTRLSKSKLRESACIEDIDYTQPRNLDRSVMQRLALCHWVKQHENVLITGATGVGKTWIACALAHKACREGYAISFVRLSRMLHDLFLARGTGTYPALMTKLAKPDVLIIDDFGLAKLSDTERRDLLEVIEDRQSRKSTIVTSQLEVKHWHEVIGEPTVADAILDRLVTSAHRIDLKGKTSLRGGKTDKKK